MRLTAKASPLWVSTHIFTGKAGAFSRQSTPFSAEKTKKLILFPHGAGRGGSNISGQGQATSRLTDAFHKGIESV
jgi:hypothetical protein